MKREFFSVSSVFLSILFVLCFTSFCFGEGIDGYFWKKMDKTQKSLYVMGYKMGSLDATLTLNSLVNLRKEIKPSDEMKIANAYCTDIIELIRKAFIRETYIPEENLEIIIGKLDLFYTQEELLKIKLSEALSKVREEMYKKNPKLEELLKHRRK